MTRSLVIIPCLFFCSCATYVPVQYLGGKIHEKGLHFERCEFAPLGQTVHQAVSPLVAVDDSRLKKEEIHSIEYERWAYLPPLIYRDCIKVNANHKLTRNVEGLESF